MGVSARRSDRRGFACKIGLALPVLLLGCVSSQQISSYLAYEPVPAPSRLPATARVQVTHVTAPEVLAAWKKWAWNSGGINGEELVANAIYEDLAKSGLFTRISRDDPKPDLLVVINSKEIRPSNFHLEIELQVLSPATNEPVLSYRLNRVYATGITDYKLKEALREVLGRFKTELVADFRNKDLSRLGGKFAVAGGHNAQPFSGLGMELKTGNDGAIIVVRSIPNSPAAAAGIQAGDRLLQVGEQSVDGLLLPAVVERLRGPTGTSVALTMLRSSAAEADRRKEYTLQRAPIMLSAEVPHLEELLVAKETNVMTARQRNRALVACKTLSLPALLRERKTAELTLLSVQIEQNVLDLNHEAELEKDRAQRAAEQNPKAVEEHRELAIAYRERIEILKPIGASIKEEIANRAR